MVPFNVKKRRIDWEHVPLCNHIPGGGANPDCGRRVGRVKRGYLASTHCWARLSSYFRASVVARVAARGQASISACRPLPNVVHAQGVAMVSILRAAGCVLKRVRVARKVAPVLQSSRSQSPS